MRYIHEAFDAWVRTTPAQDFLICTDRIWSFADVAVLVDALEAELLALHVRRGDRVLTIAENCPEHVALVLACSRVGAWSCGINARMSEGEVAAFYQKADPRVVYFTSAVSDSAKRHAANPHGAWLAGQVAPQSSVVAALQRSDCLKNAVAEVDSQQGDIAAIIFTSGTTGTPKGVLVTHAGLLQFGRVSCASRALTAQDRAYAYVPMTHIFGLGTVLMSALTAGSSLVMRSQFDPADVLDALAHHGVSNLQGPPALFVRVLAYAKAQGITRLQATSRAALRYIYTGAAPLDLELKAQVQNFFDLPLHHGYGLSEYAGALTLCTHGQWRDDTSAGYVVEGGALRLVTQEGCDAAVGETAEIWMRGVGLMPGYFRDAEATQQVMRLAEDGGQAWYASGDLGRQDTDGALTVVGRLKEMIVRSGFNVYPAEVESVLCSFSSIHRAAVLGQKQADGNEAVIAFVELEPGQTLDRDALQTHIQSHLAPYKRPSRIDIIEALPMTLSGKVLKRELLELMRVRS